MARHRGRPHERHGSDAGVVENEIDGVPGAVHEVEDTCRQPSFFEQLHEPGCGQRGPLRRLQDEGVAAHDRQGHHPERNHRREIEWSDSGDHTERIAVHVGVDPSGHLLEPAAHEQGRRAGRKLHDLEAALDVAPRFIDALSVLEDDELGQLFEIVLEQPLESEHDPGAPGRRLLRPELEGLLRRVDGAVQIVRVRQRRSGDHITGCRIPDIDPVL